LKHDWRGELEAIIIFDLTGWQMLQSGSNKRLARAQRRFNNCPAPSTLQRMPDCLRRCPTTDLQPASTTPEPMSQNVCVIGPAQPNGVGAHDSTPKVLELAGQFHTEYRINKKAHGIRGAI
jgi:hypothetical protein